MDPTPAVEASKNLVGVSGFVPPSWDGLANGVHHLDSPRTLNQEHNALGGSTKRLPVLSACSVTRICLGGWPSQREHW